MKLSRNEKQVDAMRNQPGLRMTRDSSVAKGGGIMPDFNSAIEYARGLLLRLPAHLTYHSYDHTFGEVMPAAMRLARSYDLDARQTSLLAVAAAFHDSGWMVGETNHEQTSVDMARQALPAFGFAPRDMDSIADIILATRIPQSPKNTLERIIADADLDGLGSPDFLTRSNALRAEHCYFGRFWSDQEWYAIQVRFLEDHSYFTGEARRLREATKQRNLADMRQRLARAINDCPPHADATLY